MHKCDNWVVLKFKATNETFYRLLVGTSGGYLSGDSWRMNSGIEECRKDGDYFIFSGNSGSEYKCHKDAYGVRMNIIGVISNFQAKYKDKVAMVSRPDDYDWTTFNWHP